jgi:hypothetical protein
MQSFGAIIKKDVSQAFPQIWPADSPNSTCFCSSRMVRHTSSITAILWPGTANTISSESHPVESFQGLVPEKVWPASSRALEVSICKQGTWMPLLARWRSVRQAVK